MGKIESRRSQIRGKRSHSGKISKTPAGFLAGHRRPKKTRLPRCPVTGITMNGVASDNNIVRRAYGGVLSGRAVRERIIRAFLIEEQSIVRRVLLLQRAKE